MDLSLLLRKRFTTLAIFGILCLFFISWSSSHAWWTSAMRQPVRTPGLSNTDKDLFASKAINNTVIIVPTNAGHMHWVENLLCSLESTSFQTANVLFWALDTEAQSILTAKGRATYHDPSLFSTSANENFHGDTEAYKRMMKERPKAFIDFLAAGFDILLLDADTVFWDSPLSIVPPNDTDVDVVYSTDAREFYQSHPAFLDERRRGSLMPPVCNGIFWMRSSPATIALWTEMLHVFQFTGWKAWYYRRYRQFLDDQRGMDVMLNDGRARLVEPFPSGITAVMVPTPPVTSMPDLNLKIQLLDQTQVVNGQLLINRQLEYSDNLVKLREHGKDRISAHFNWDTKVISKEDGAKQLGLYLLDAEGRCNASTPAYS